MAGNNSHITHISIFLPHWTVPMKFQRTALLILETPSIRSWSIEYLKEGYGVLLQLTLNLLLFFETPLDIICSLFLYTLNCSQELKQRIPSSPSI